MESLADKTPNEFMNLLRMTYEDVTTYRDFERAVESIFSCYKYYDVENPRKYLLHLYYERAGARDFQKITWIKRALRSSRLKKY